VIPGVRAGKKYNKVGAVVADPAFLSTSTSLTQAQRAVQDAYGTYKTAATLEIKVPRGSSAFDLEAHRVGGGIIKPMGRESEMLLPRGVELKVVSYDPEKNHSVLEYVQ